MKRIMILVVSLALLLVACYPRNELGRLLFDNNDCAPPCFLGIIPGTTSEVEARTIVSTNKLFKNCQEYDYTSQGGIRGIECESILMVFDQSLVTQIGFSPFSVSIEEVINKYGNPDGLVVLKGNLPEASSKVKASLWYRDINTQITLPERNGDAYVMDPGIQVEYITYYSEAEFENITKSITNIELWEGYKTYLGKLP